MLRVAYDVRLTSLRLALSGALLLAAGGLAALADAKPGAEPSSADSAIVPLGGLPVGGISRADARRLAAASAELGRQMFFDPSLSASGRMACSGCHDPAHGFTPANDRAVQLGGVDLDRPGERKVPSLTYLQAAPQFTEHFFDNDDEGDESVDGGPTGGITWDGRVDNGRDQARIPLLSDYEMADASPAAVVAKVAVAPYADGFKALYGPDVFADEARAFDAVTKALEAYEEDWRTFYPYSSRYDAWLAGKAELSRQEKHGLELFEAEDKGNCASCHLSRRGNDGTPPQFTDFSLLALAVPRNAEIPANRDPRHFDLGVCGPLRKDLADHPDDCGLFLTPTLRNVALRSRFFHNGAIGSLRDAVAFYATRDTDPARWYPRAADGSVMRYDDLPERYWANINRDPPFGGKPGGTPALSDAEIDDVVAFLKTLTDGYFDPSAGGRSASP